MIRPRSFRASRLILCLLAASQACTAFAEDARCTLSALGLVVETVRPESAGLRAGFIPGDRLYSWCRTLDGQEGCVAHGDLHIPFDWRDLEIEDVQHGGVVVEGAHGAESRRWNLLPVGQGLTVAPLLQGALGEAYHASRDRETSGDPASAGEQMERAAELASGNHCTGAELWLRDQAAQLRAKARQGSEVDKGYQAALAKAQALQAARTEAHLHMSWWWLLLQRGEITQAKQQLESALRLEEKDHPESLFEALVLIRLGFTAEKLDNLEEADRLQRRAYELTRHAAPGSGAEASAANNVAAITAMRGDLAQAELYLARALAIQEKLSPSGDGDGFVMKLWNYGELLLNRGDLAGAEAAFLRARKTLEKLRPESTDMATTLRLLGETADRRGDHEAAESLFRRELALFEKLDPDGSRMLERLMGLGNLALLQHQDRRAEEFWQRALAISDELNPAGPKSASCRVGLAEAMRLRGRRSEAKRLLRRALATWERINPEAVDTGSIHLQLGILLLERGNAQAAEAHLRAAIRIHEKYHGLLPESYQALARLQARRGQAKAAAASYLAAVNALEAQQIHLGGARESRWLYGSSLGDLYFEAAEHQIALRRPQEAWRFIERGRARGFQEMLAQRDLRFAGEIPPPLYAERRRLDAKYDQVQAALANWAPEQGTDKLEALQDRLRDLRLEQTEAQERIRHSSPRIAALEGFNPLDLAAARSALDPGTVLLTYAVGASRSYLFVIDAEGVPGPGFFFYSLPIGKKELGKEVEAFRSLLGRPQTLLSAVKQRGRHLYDLLVRPAKTRLAKADRWLISPDGPLHSLPFAALLSGDHYLAESKPIHIVASAAVYKEIKATRSKQPSTAAMEILAVGNPHYPAGFANSAETARDPQMQDALRRGLRLKPLPATRGEVEEISKLFPGGRVLLDRDATEDAVKSMAPQARRLHFACHGLLDERFPLNSALALSTPEHPEDGHDNGLLQAWEIFDELRLDADLVTLSACDSGLGKEMGGEGLIGLARAFQFAGARSVLASLWSIADVSTARFMERFYGYLSSGKTKDEALQAAQIDMIRQKSGSSHPFHWAAFELFGDWR